MQQLVPEASQFPAAATRRQTEGHDDQNQADAESHARFEACVAAPATMPIPLPPSSSSIMYGAIKWAARIPELEPDCSTTLKSQPSGDRLALAPRLTDDQMAGLIRAQHFRDSRCKNGDVFRAGGRSSAVAREGTSQRRASDPFLRVKRNPVHALQQLRAV